MEHLGLLDHLRLLLEVLLGELKVLAQVGQQVQLQVLRDGALQVQQVKVLVKLV